MSPPVDPTSASAAPPPYAGSPGAGRPPQEPTPHQSRVFREPRGRPALAQRARRAIRVTIERAPAPVVSGRSRHRPGPGEIRDERREAVRRAEGGAVADELAISITSAAELSDRSHFNSVPHREQRWVEGKGARFGSPTVDESGSQE